MQPAFAAQEPLSPQDAHFSQWMTYYYVHKDTSKMADFLQWMQSSHFLEKHEHAIRPVAAFLSVAFADNPQQAREWVTGAQFTGKARDAVEYSLWLSGNGTMIADGFEDAPDYAQSHPTALAHWTLKDAGDLDMMWGAFSASGDTAYAKKIIEVLDDDVPLTGDTLVDTITRASAEWSLGSNMMQHELVNRLIRREIGVRTGSVKRKLEEIVARNDQRARHFPNRAGEFSAMLVVTDEEQLAEYEKPSTEGMHFIPVSQANRGDVLAIKIVFAGMELTGDLGADVTYDLRILDPEGKPYGNDFRNEAALKAKVPMRFRVYDNRSFVMIRFDPNDKLGNYQIVAALHDNVGQQTIPLTKEIELTN